MVLEGAMIVIDSLALMIMHPGIGFGRVAWAERKGIGISDPTKVVLRRRTLKRSKRGLLDGQSDCMRR